jgi:hypothetical protein
MRPELMVAGDLAEYALLTKVLELGMPGVDKRTVLLRYSLPSLEAC